MWKSLDQVEKPPVFLESSDLEDCYFARDYISHGGYGASEANHLVSNFKKGVEKRDCSEWSRGACIRSMVNDPRREHATAASAEAESRQKEHAAVLDEDLKGQELVATCISLVAGEEAEHHRWDHYEQQPSVHVDHPPQYEHRRGEHQEHGGSEARRVAGEQHVPGDVLERIPQRDESYGGERE